MLRKTKNFLKANGVYYEKEHVNPLMVPERVIVGLIILIIAILAYLMKLPKSLLKFFYR